VDNRTVENLRQQIWTTVIIIRASAANYLSVVTMLFGFRANFILFLAEKNEDRLRFSQLINSKLNLARFGSQCIFCLRVLVFQHFTIYSIIQNTNYYYYYYYYRRI